MTTTVTFGAIDGVTSVLQIDTAVGRQPELIGAGAGNDGRTLVVAHTPKNRTQLADDRCERTRSVAWRIIAPQTIRQAIGRNRTSLLQAQPSQRQPTLSTGQVTFVDRTLIADDGDPTAQMHPQTHRSPIFSPSPGRTVAPIGQKERFMEQVIECPCGTVLRGADLSEVIEQAQTHAHEVHDMELTDEQATSMARPA